MTDDLVTRLNGLADCDSRAGEPLGKCMREAAARIEEQAATIARLEGERDNISDKLELGRALTDGAHRRARAAEAQVAELKQEAGMFLALWAVRHAEMQGLADGEIHPQHYDRMAELGCRMDAFTRAAIAAAKEGA